VSSPVYVSLQAMLTFTACKVNTKAKHEGGAEVARAQAGEVDGQGREAAGTQVSIQGQVLDGSVLSLRLAVQTQGKELVVHIHTLKTRKH